ncbi:MAG: hypothetical protein ACXWWC_05450 [Chitinophagaceae bacterium]
MLQKRIIKDNVQIHFASERSLAKNWLRAKEDKAGKIYKRLCDGYSLSFSDLSCSKRRPSLVFADLPAAI